jgi:hypothetical protein
MNSAPRSVTGTGRLARKENASTRPAFGKEERLDFLVAGESPGFGAGTTPQDPCVSLAVRRMSLTMERLLWLSEFNAVIEVRCLINESSSST